MEIRNAVLIALAFNPTEAEVAAAHDLVDRLAGGVDPTLLISGSVNGVTGAVLTSTPEGAAPANPAATAAPSNPAGAAVLDAAGLPWDDRIHSSNKKLNDKGTWWAKRGVTPALKSQVEAELRATLGSASAASAPANPTNTAPQPGAAGGPPMPGANTNQPPMPGAASVDPAYAALVSFIAQNTQSSANPGAKFDEKYIKDVLTHYGVADGSLQNLAHRLDLVPTIHNWLASVLAS